MKRDPSSPPIRCNFFSVISLVWFAASQAACFAQPDPSWKIHDISRPRPPVIKPGTPSTQERPGEAPSDATALFGGKDLSHWASLDGSPAKWIVREGHMECVKGSGYVRTLQNFGDCQLHLEWAAPVPPRGQSQGRGNSGVFLMGLYEVQILDSFENLTYADGQASAVYGQYPPMVNAVLPAGHWQTYEIIFTRPRFDGTGALASPARLTVLHNGVLVQNNTAVVGPTGWMKRDAYRAHADKLPLSLQDHGNPVRFRNIWIRELSDAAQQEFTFSTSLLDRFVGEYVAEDGLKITISRAGSQMSARLQFPGRDNSFPLFAASRTEFFMKTVDARLIFPPDAEGTADRMTFRIGGESRPVKRIP